jgi:hypothetical protein
MHSFQKSEFFNDYAEKSLETAARKRDRRNRNIEIDVESKN